MARAARFLGSPIGGSAVAATMRSPAAELHRRRLAIAAASLRYSCVAPARGYVVGLPAGLAVG
jgi:hypothetical protein